MEELKNIIGAIEAKLQAQKDEIYLKDLQIVALREQLDEAEKEIEKLKGAK